MNKIFWFFKVIFLMIFFNSCSLKTTEIEKLKSENEKLKEELKELRSFRDSLKVVPYIDNTTFKTMIDEPYYLQLLSIIPNDLKIENIYINGKEIELSMRKDLLKYNEYGPRIKFVADSAGVYEFEVNARMNVYDNEIIPLSFPIEVKGR